MNESTGRSNAKMRVFVTGATGFIGSAVVRELLAAGHTVLGLARSDATAEALVREGIEAHRGDLLDEESLAVGARECDGVIHLAFNHEFATTTREAAAELDRKAVEAMTGAIGGSGKPFVLTSGTALLPLGQIATEADEPRAGNVGNPRGASETTALEAADRGVRVSVVRLPPTVHGEGDHGFVPAVIEIARRKGLSGYIAEGANRWPAVHRLDAARLFRLALESAAPGARLHAVAEEGVAFREIAETIGEGLGIPTRGLSPAEADAHFEWMAHFVGLDNPTSSAITRDALGWAPEGPDLLTDLRANGYF